MPFNNVSQSNLYSVKPEVVDGKVNIRFKHINPDSKLSDAKIKKMKEEDRLAFDSGGEMKVSPQLYEKYKNYEINRIEMKNSDGNVKVLKEGSIKISTMSGKESKALSLAVDQLLTYVLEKKLLAEQARFNKVIKESKDTSAEAPPPPLTDRKEAPYLGKRQIYLHNQKNEKVNQAAFEGHNKALKEARERDNVTRREFEVSQRIQRAVRTYAQGKELVKENNKKEDIKREPHLSTDSPEKGKSAKALHKRVIPPETPI